MQLYIVLYTIKYLLYMYQGSRFAGSKRLRFTSDISHGSSILLVLILLKLQDFRASILSQRISNMNSSQMTTEQGQSQEEALDSFFVN